MGMDSYIYKYSKENIETIINELKTNPTFFEKMLCGILTIQYMQ